MNKEGVILRPLLSALFFITLSQSNTFSQDKSSILFNWKDWGTYSEHEKDSLRSRWTDEKIQKVVCALKTGTQLPDFISKIGSRNSTPGYDLRGIQLKDQHLDSVVLSHAYLDGAILINSHLILAVFDSASLEYVNLQGAHLEMAHLQGANLQNANLEGAYLGYANLQGDSLSNANLQGANLYSTNLQGAYLHTTNLQGAGLWHANLQRAGLLGTILKETSLFQARFDTTNIWQTNLAEARNIRDIVWGDSLQNRYLIFVEIIGDTITNAKDREIAFKYAKTTYRDLKAIYKKEGMEEVANGFHFRENEVQTKLSPWFICVLRIVFLKWTYGYGSRPTQLFGYAICVILGFAVAFLVLTSILKWKSGLYLGKVEDNIDNLDKKRIWTQRKGWVLLDCLYFSTLALCTFGYGALQLKELIKLFKLKPLELIAVRWARVLVALEAALGIWLFALLAIVLFGRG